MKDKSLSSKRKDSYTVEDLQEGLYRGKDVREAVLLLEEDIKDPYPDRILSITDYRNWILSRIKKRFGSKLI